MLMAFIKAPCCTVIDIYFISNHYCKATDFIKKYHTRINWYLISSVYSQNLATQTFTNLLTFSSLGYYCSWISHISNIKMVFNEYRCWSCGPIVPESILFRIQEVHIRLLVCFTWDIDQIQITNRIQFWQKQNSWINSRGRGNYGNSANIFKHLEP